MQQSEPLMILTAVFLHLILKNLWKVPLRLIYLISDYIHHQHELQILKCCAPKLKIPMLKKYVTETSKYAATTKQNIPNATTNKIWKVVMSKIQGNPSDSKHSSSVRWRKSRTYDKFSICLMDI